MKKIINLTYAQGFFFLNIFSGIIKGKTEDDIINKVKIFDALQGIKAKRDEFSSLSREEQMDYNIQSFSDSVAIELDSEVIDWIKQQWKNVPSEYKLYNQNGSVIQEGLNSEEECRMYLEIKISLEDTQLVK